MVGVPALSMLCSKVEAANVVYGPLRSLGKDEFLQLPSRAVSPKDAIRDLLRRAREDAQRGLLNEKAKRVVIARKSSSKPLVGDLLESAAKDAGFDLVCVIDDSVAAAIAADRAFTELGDNFVVVNAGASAWSVSAVCRTE